jgi:isorenieratene synthase
VTHLISPRGAHHHPSFAGHPGRDRRAVRWPARQGALRRVPPGTRAAVVGGGIAGLAAATALAERGVRVDLFEREGSLGGRLAGWPTRLADGSTATMSRGFHAFFRQYYNLRSLLRRADPALRTLVPLADYPLQRAGGPCDSFRHVPRTPPWNVLGFAALSPTFTPSGLRGLRPRAALPLLDVRVPGVYEQLDGISAADFLDAVGFPPEARHLAFEVFSRSFFAAPQELSAAELVLMFHVYFLGSAEGLLFDVPAEPFPTALWEPLARYLGGLGARVRTGRAVEEVRPEGEGFRVASCGGGAERDPWEVGAREAGTQQARAQEPGAQEPGAQEAGAWEAGAWEARYDSVVLALDSRSLAALVSRSPRLGDAAWRERIQRLRQAPPFLVSRYWLDQPVAPGRPGFLGTSGYGALDNVSVLERWEGEAARWSARTGGSVIEAHAYAVAPGTDRAATEHRLREELARVYPETATATALDVRHEWRSDCPLFPVGGYGDRPRVRTAHPRLVVAGDLVRTRLPTALMERAATSGFQAANALLSTWNTSGHDLWSVPVEGRSAPLRALARLGRR